MMRRAGLLSDDGNLPYLLSGAANSAFMELTLIRHDSHSSAFPAYRKRLERYLLKPSPFRSILASFLPAYHSSAPPSLLLTPP